MCLALSSRFPTGSDTSKPAQLQRLVRSWKICLWYINFNANRIFTFLDEYQIYFIVCEEKSVNAEFCIARDEICVVFTEKKSKLLLFLFYIQRKTKKAHST